jgi:hypothetical protein
VLPPTGTTGANVTPVITVVASSDGSGLLAAYPTATTAPAISTLNFTSGRSFSNSAVVKTGTGGSVTVAVNGTAAYITVSCNGYFADA